MADGPTIRTGETSIVLHVPFQFKRRAGRKEIVTPTSLAGADSDYRATQDAMITALARAHKWKDMLETGEAASITDLAQRFGVDGSYVGRILRLTLLAPDIIEAILEGREPSGLSLRKLTVTFPAEWEEQRKKFEFQSTTLQG